MPEIRQDPTTKEWVIIASERAKRPHDFTHRKNKPELPAYDHQCPFCLGNEAMTPPEVLKYQGREDQGWRVRAFSNKFPALTKEGNATRRKREGFYFGMNGIGVHEVIVETPLHNRPLALMDDGGVRDVLMAYQERYKILFALPYVKSVIIFKNHGSAAGTSLEHPHSQIVALPIMPRQYSHRHDVAIQYYDDTGRSLYSDMIAHELNKGKRLIMENEDFVAFQPYASHRPFETWIVPRSPEASFAGVTSQSITSLASILRIVLLKLFRGLEDPDFNYVIDSAPPGDENSNYYLWHLRLIPRITEVAGFEIGSGIYINPAVPEQTAKFMRELEV